MLRISEIKLPLDHDDAALPQAIATALDTPVSSVREFKVFKRSFDARKPQLLQVDAEPAREMARRCAVEEGILVGISSGATLAAIAQKLPSLAPDAVVLGFNYDTGERYLSVEGFLPA